MTDRYEAVAVRRYEDRDGNEKTAFTNIGVAWRMKERDGYTVRLNAIPAPDQGEFVILLMPPKPKEEQQQQRPSQGQRSGGDYGNASGRSNRPAQSSYDNDLDDDIPF